LFNSGKQERAALRVGTVGQDVRTRSWRTRRIRLGGLCSSPKLTPYANDALAQDPTDPVQIQANMLSHPDDLKSAITGVELCREIGNSAALRPFAKREVMPGNLEGAELERFIRDAASTYWHRSCTAKMGQDAMSVVDGTLKVYGIQHLRITDGSISPVSPLETPWPPASSLANAPPTSSRPSTHSDIAPERLTYS
jgi:choline dehydrogenase-like flavoprotein